MMKVNDVIRDYPKILKTEFKNEFGEKFTIFRTPWVVAFGGDETDQEVIPLFNQEFGVWGRDELTKLGKALIDLAQYEENDVETSKLREMWRRMDKAGMKITKVRDEERHGYDKQRAIENEVAFRTGNEEYESSHIQDIKKP